MELETAQNKRHKILLVEDNEIDRTAFIRLVEEKKLPYDYTVAKGLTDSMDILNDKKYDVVVLNYILDDGIAFGLPELTKDTPVIMITGVGDEEIAAKAVKAGIYDYYLVKDINRSYLNIIPAAIEKVIERKKTMDKLQEFNVLKNEFIANVSHELRTPLTIFKYVISNALAGVNGPISPSLRQKLEIADEAVKRLARVINNFNDISEIEAGNLVLRFTEFDLKSEIIRILNSLLPLTKEKNIELKLNPSICDLPINADCKRISQVLTEIIDNAIKFTKQNGHINISVQKTDSEVYIEVNNDGVGVDVSEIENIFDRFVKVKKTTGAAEHGTELGFSIAKKLVEMHDGRIEVQGRPDHGTNVTVFLPLDPKYVSESETVMV